MSWSPVQGVLSTVPDQETEETQPYAPKREQDPKCGNNEEEKKNKFRSEAKDWINYLRKDEKRAPNRCH
jgi:hypothetical protein